MATIEVMSKVKPKESLILIAIVATKLIKIEIKYLEFISVITFIILSFPTATNAKEEFEV